MAGTALRPQHTAAQACRTCHGFLYFSSLVAMACMMSCCRWMRCSPRSMFLMYCGRYMVHIAVQVRENEFPGAPLGATASKRRPPAAGAVPSPMCRQQLSRRRQLSSYPPTFSWSLISVYRSQNTLAYARTCARGGKEMRHACEFGG